MKKKIKYKRIGKCKQCGMCCMLRERIMSVPRTSKSYISLHNKSGWTKFHETKKDVYFANLLACYQLYVANKGKFRCKLHEKNKPKICKEWPFSPTEEYYRVLKKFCGFRFVRIENNINKPNKGV